MRSLFTIFLIIAGLTSFAYGVVEFDKDGKAIHKEHAKIDLEAYTGEWIIQLNDESNYISVEEKVKGQKGKVLRELKSSKKAGKAKTGAEVIK